MLDGLDRVIEAMEEAARPRRRRRTQIGWRQVAVQVVYVAFWVAVVALLLSPLQ